MIAAVLTGAVPAARGHGLLEVQQADDARPIQLQKSLEDVAGSAGKDCGHVSLARLRAVQSDSTVKCVQEALKQKAPFIASFQQHGTDSLIIQGIAATSGGVVTIQFDQAYPGYSTPSISAPKLCSNPSLEVSKLSELLGLILGCE